MNRLATLGRFWWDFVVGDDWLAAVCIVAAIGATAALAAAGIAAWWVMPIGVAATLYSSLRRLTGGSS
jgi:hypothetical protein